MTEATTTLTRAALERNPIVRHQAKPGYEPTVTDSINELIHFCAKRRISMVVLNSFTNPW